MAEEIYYALIALCIGLNVYSIVLNRRARRTYDDAQEELQAAKQLRRAWELVHRKVQGNG